MRKAGDKVTAFELPDLEGNPVALGGQQNGPLLLAFFKVSCPVCQYTFPFLERVAGKGTLPVIGISQDNPSATRDFSRTYGLNFPMLLDRADQGYQVSNAFGITTVPSVFVIERDQRISTAFSGFSRRDLEEVGRKYGVQVFHQGEKTPDFKPG